MLIYHTLFIGNSELNTCNTACSYTVSCSPPQKLMNVTRALRGVLSSVPTPKVHSSAAAGVASDWVPMAEAVLVCAYLPNHTNSNSILSLSLSHSLSLPFPSLSLSLSLSLTLCLSPSFSFSADINECSEGTSGCTDSCTNTQGSFQCGCNNGFTLGGDGRTCVGMYTQVLE